MNVLFWIAAAIAVFSTVRALTHFQAVRALLYVIVSFFSIAVIFFILGAPFAAALEVITYAGAIMVLFVFVVMMLNLGSVSEMQERAWLRPEMLIGPTLLSALLLADWGYAVIESGGQNRPIVVLGPEIVGEILLTRYLIGVELASILLLAGLVGAYHVGYRKRAVERRREELSRAA